MSHYVAFINALMEAFPNTQIYPALGNHEPHPCNMFPPSDVWADYDLAWMYNFHGDLYQTQLTAAALATFRRGGYYTQIHKPGWLKKCVDKIMRNFHENYLFSGFRIVTLNTNFCYTNNFWILWNAADPEEHLQWFSNTMYAAERSNEKVWIVGHVPPGGKDCWSKWSSQFLRVINRYQNIILAQFYGHTHNDEFKIFFDDSRDPPQPTGSLWIGASVTPYTGMCIRIYS